MLIRIKPVSAKWKQTKKNSRPKLANDKNEPTKVALLFELKDKTLILSLL